MTATIKPHPELKGAEEPAPSGVRRGKSEESKRLAPVDLVRSFAIIMAMGLHLLGSGASAPAKGFWFDFWYHGGYGFILFFTVSGFIISYATANREKLFFQLSPKRFFVFRASRVLPLLMFVVALGVLFRNWAPLGKTPQFYACFWNTTQKYDTTFWVSIATFWFNWLKSMRAAHGPMAFHWDVMWTLSIEEQFYISFPFLVLAAGSRRAFARVLLIVIALCPFVRWETFAFHPTKLAAGVASSFGYFDQIAVGCLLFLLWQKYGERLAKAPKLAAGICAFGGITLLSVFFGTNLFATQQQVYAPTMLSFATAIFVMGALALPSFNRLPGWLVLPGKLTYGLYLYQAISLYFCWNFIAGKPFWFAFPVWFSVDMVIAYLSFELFEKPVNKALRKLLSPKQPATITVTVPDGVVEAAIEPVSAKSRG